MINSVKLGDEIKRFRKSFNNSDQKDFAKLIGISNVHLSNLENGKKFPSKKLLKRIYTLINQEVPENILELLTEAKGDNKKSASYNVSNDLIYSLQENGFYDEKKLKDLLKTEPENIKFIYGYLTLLNSENKTEEAREHLLQSLIHIKNIETKRWLEALYFLLERNYLTSIQLMNKSLSELEKNKSNYLESFPEKKAGYLFELANIYYEYAYNLFNFENNIDLAIQNFQKSLEIHEELRDLYKKPYYEMHYANCFWWLAFLGVNKISNWKSYIKFAEDALLLNHNQIMINQKNGKYSSPLYSKPYFLQIVSGLSEAYAQLALIFVEQNKPKEKIYDYLKRGEILLALNSPININIEKKEYYNFYFSFACFYSIKSEIKSGFNENYDNELFLCYKALIEAKNSDSKSNRPLFIKDLNFSGKSELKFYCNSKKEELESLKR